MRIISVLVTIVATTSPSFAADPPQISIDAPSNPYTKLDEARVDVRAAGDVSLVKLRLGLVSPAVRSTITRLGISIPGNARVVGMELSQSDSAFTALAMTTREARGEFDEHKEWHIDPAMLEWHGESDGRRRLLLSMSPITDTPSTVTVMLAIPHLQRLDLDVAGSRRTIPRAAFARATAEDRAIAARQEFVTREQALYAGPTDPRPTDDNVQRYVRASYPDLRLCYESSNAHETVMHFTIANGHVHDLSLDGVPERTTNCVADLLDRWTFLAFEETVEVNHPLHFIALPSDVPALLR